MRPTDALFAIAASLVVGAVGPIVYLLLKQLTQRRTRAAALAKVARAREAMATRDLTEAARGLAGFDAATLDRTFEQLLEENMTPQDAAWLGQLAQQLGAVERYCERARRSPTWSERAFAVRTLGRMGAPAAARTLSEVLRDRTEDDAVRSVAADALAAIQDPAVIPLLVAELGTVDETSTPRAAEALIRFGHAATPALIAALAGNEQQGGARLWAARVLSAVKDRAAADALLTGLRDRNDLVRVACAEALGAIREQRALQQLMYAALRDPAPLVRSQCALAAAQISGAEATDVLLAALSDPDYATRLRALEAFESMQLADTSALEKALADANAEVRRRAALALERLGYLDKLVEALAGDDPAARRTAYAALLAVGRAGLVDSLGGRLRHASMQVRVAIARACAELQAERSAPALIAALGDPAWPVRAAVCEALQRLRPKAGAAALVPLLTEPEECVREAAASALAAYDSKDVEIDETSLRVAFDNGSVPVRLAILELWSRRRDARPPLVEALRDASEAVRLRAIGSLALYPDPDATQALIACLTDASLEVRMATVPALGACATAEAFEALLRALAGAPAGLRERIAEALSGVGRQHLLTNVAELARSSSLDVRLGVAWTLGKIADPVGVPVLQQFLADGDPRLRASAAGALGKFTTDDAVKALLRASGDPDPKTRAAVVNALGKSGAGQASVRNALKERLRDPDSFVRNRAGIALARVAGSSIAQLAQDPELKTLIDAPALVIMQGLIGTEESVALALHALSDAQQLPGIQRYFEREEPALCKAFLSNLRLYDADSDSFPLQLEPAALAEQYERLLRMSQDERARRAAVESLAGMKKVAPHLDVLAAALGADPDPAVRLRCAEVLAQHVAEPIARNAITRAVSDPDVKVAVSAALSLRACPEPEVRSALFRRLGSGSSAVNEAVVQALADLYRDDVQGFIDRMLGAERPATIAAAVLVIERIANPGVLPVLGQLLKSQDQEIRAAAVRAFSGISPLSAGSVSSPAFDDPSELVRVAALDASARAGARALPRLVACIHDPSIAVRTRLCELLERFPESAASQTLEALTADGAPRVAAAAILSLLSFATPGAFQRFEHQLARATPETLEELRRDPRADTVARKLAKLIGAGGDASQREAAVRAITSLAVPDYEQLLLPVLRDPRSGVRLAAARALIASRSPQVQARVAELLDDPEPAVRDSVRSVVSVGSA